MKKMPRLGDQEMQILTYINENAPVSVRNVAEHFEKSSGLARTTILTVMERLRKKGFLARTQAQGVFQYTSKVKTGDVISSSISEFIEKTLGGSVSPLISYFLSSESLSVEEVEQLKSLAAKLEKKES